MKYSLLVLILVGAMTAQGQKLKDLLYSGKLKNDSGTVIRKTDDLTTKIDTARKKPVEVKEEPVSVPVTGNETGTNAVTGTEPAAGGNNPANPNTPAANAGPKDNNTIWKEYMVGFMEELKTDVVPDKRLKPGTYYILVEYEIGVDGSIGINKVLPSPESSYLQDQVKQRLTLSAPKMAPVMVSGKAKVVVKKYNFTLTK